MSAMLGVCLPDRLHLMSDGAVFCEGRPGVLVGQMEKIIWIPGMTAAFIARGAWIANERFLAACDGVGSFDELIGGLDAVLDTFDEAMREASHIDTELLIGGWSDDLDRPRLLYRAMHDRTPGVEPGNVYEVTAFTTGDAGLLPADLTSFQPADGIASFEAARRAEVDGGSHIGVAVYHAQIAAGATPRTVKVHEWLDALGTLIT
ncbi:hypothetical protein [Hansschlegelia beijingensis]|uniref:Uncharacterized protein n=1 Tax=Hansschlegelia beijingensis TaxID=1133344 RepID=A0A7W6D180_9HYPH|nr:hypothetical protein [Hansschlegelia beijingensis]MBB3972510.1 hypothetical protein [Hansschlegelia beijingensis]